MFIFMKTLGNVLLSSVVSSNVIQTIITFATSWEIVQSKSMQKLRTIRDIMKM